MDNIVHHKRFYKNEKYSDVEFMLTDRDGNACVIPAHRFLLMSRSNVFEPMLYGDMKEGHKVNITDVSAEAFEEFLQFFYLEKVNLTMHNIGEVLKLIDKYNTRTSDFPSCEKFMTQSVSESSAYEYYALALSFNLSSEVKEVFEKILGQNRRLVFDLGDDVSKSRLVISSMLQSDEFVGEEIDIFKDVIATPQNIKDELGDLIKYIRFPIMSSKALIDCMKEHPLLLTQEELIDITDYVVHGTPMSQAVVYNTRARLSGRFYSVSFATYNSYSNSNQGSLELQWNEHTSSRFLVSLKIDANGHSQCSITVKKKMVWQLAILTLEI